MIKVLAIFGTRPEAIKMAPLVKALSDTPGIKCETCITAQHRQMLDQVLDAFSIVPDYDLDIMEPRQTLGDITTKVLAGLEGIIEQTHPTIALVHGDTTTAFAGALAAFYSHTPIGHVEAGLRTWDKHAPFPEEMNRQMIDCLADMHFAPTKTSKRNLIGENRNEANIFVTGNTAIDALKTTVKKDYRHPILDWCKGSRLILLTAHRRENTGTPMYNIFRAVNSITCDYDDVRVVYPIHMNPLVRNIADEVLANNERVRMIEPLDVIDFHNFMNAAYIILTDSGGMQEEAPSLGKPVLVLRDTTERPEGVECGTLLLAGTEEASVYELTKRLLDDSELYNQMGQRANPYGDGFASRRIVDAILERYARVISE